MCDCKNQFILDGSGASSTISSLSYSFNGFFCFNLLNAFPLCLYSWMRSMKLKEYSSKTFYLSFSESKETKAIPQKSSFFFCISNDVLLFYCFNSLISLSNSVISFASKLKLLVSKIFFLLMIKLSI